MVESRKAKEARRWRERELKQEIRHELEEFADMTRIFAYEDRKGVPHDTRMLERYKFLKEKYNK